MKRFWPAPLCDRAIARIRQLRSDTSGVAAIEFVFIVPLMLAICFGVIQFSTAYAVDRKVTLTARTLSDLISQATSISNTDISNAFSTTLAIMAPYSTTPVQSKISQVYIDSTLTAKVKWSSASNATAHTCNEVVPIPSALKVAGTYLIFSEVTYPFQPIVGFSIASQFKSPTYALSEQMYTRPRQSLSVAFPTAPACT